MTHKEGSYTVDTQPEGASMRNSSRPGMMVLWMPSVVILDETRSASCRHMGSAGGCIEASSGGEWTILSMADLQGVKAVYTGSDKAQAPSRRSAGIGNNPAGSLKPSRIKPCKDETITF